MRRLRGFPSVRAMHTGAGVGVNDTLDEGEHEGDGEDSPLIAASSPSSLHLSYSPSSSSSSSSSSSVSSPLAASSPASVLHRRASRAASNDPNDRRREQRTRDSLRRWEERRKLHKLERGELVRSTLLLLNVFAQIVLTVGAMEYQWNGKTMETSKTSLGIRTAISILTGLLVLQMVEDYIWKIWKDATDMKKRAKRVKEERKRANLGTSLKYLGTQATSHRRYYLPVGGPALDYSFHTPAWMILMEYLPFRFYVGFLLRLLISLPHIAPFLDPEMTQLATMLTFLKLFVALSVMRHFNPIYRDRHLIHRIPGSSMIEMPRFTTWFSTRTFYHLYPLTFSLASIFLVVVTSAYGIYIYERQAQPSVFDYKLSLVIAIENLITGWPGDVFSEHSIETDGGKTCSILASLGGLFFFALVINFLYIKLSPRSNDSHVVDWIARIKLEDAEKQQAAKLIQTVWRRHRERAANRERQQSHGFRLITVSAEKSFQVRFRQQCHKLRRIRRDLVELYARTGDRLETHSTSGSEKKATKKKRKSKDKSESEKSDEFELEHRAEGKTKSEDKKPVGKEDVACTPEEWQRQRERVRKYYTKAARNLHKLMAELER